jgi:hypothetical protein
MLHMASYTSVRVTMVWTKSGRQSTRFVVSRALASYPSYGMDIDCT